jgi:TPR repeat protein
MRPLLLGLWLLAAAAAGAVAGEFDAGMAAFARGDFATALERWRPLAEQGDAAAQNELGVMYGAGLGVARDDAIAALWFRRAALQGYPRAQHNLGRLYRFGLGVERNPQVAAGWIKASARTGYVKAQATLGALYAGGEGVPKDLLRAYFWWTLAAGQGDFESVKGREDIAYMLSPHQIRVGNLLAERWVPEPGAAELP